MLVWVVGAGGLLGSAVVARARAADADVFDATPVPWSDEDQATAVIQADVARFVSEAGAGRWALVWAAGAAVVASDDTDTAPELRLLTALLTALADDPPPGPGTVFVTSSAGGVYAGSHSPPFDADTEPCPISPYGRLKLAQEVAATRTLGGRIPLVIGRFSNLYGSEHKLSKGQGLIPLLCHATLHRQPLNLYVSMDTVRDYLLVDDAAAMTWAILAGPASKDPATVRTIVIASGQPTTVAEVIGTVQNVAHRRVPLALGTHDSAQHQTIDLRLVPSPSLAGIDRTPLPSGVKRVYTALAGRAG